MPITPLYAGLEGDPLNSTGEQIASTVNALIAATEGVPQSLFFDKATLDLNFATNSHKVYEPFGLASKVLTDAVTTARNSTATYDTPTSIATAAVNTPRIEYATATGDVLGLLCEEQRTNLLLRSQEFDNASWIQNPNADVDVTANAAIAPDGTMTADKFVEATTANTFHDLFQNGSFVAGTRYVASIFVKAGERTRGALVFGNSGVGTGFTSERFVFFNLATKTVTAGGTGSAAGIEEYQNGWFRIWISGTADANGTSPVFIRIQNSAGTSIYSGAPNSGFFVWGAQVEAGSSPTSYIPTTTAQVTRVADVISRTLNVAAINEGTIFAIARGEGGVLGVNQAIFTLSDGTSSNRVLIRRNNTTAGTNYLVASGGNVVAQVNTTQKVAGQRNKYAISWKTNQFLAAEDGTLVMNDTSGSAPANLSQLGIGSTGTAFGGAEPLNGTIERLVFIPRALTAAELQAITS